MTFNKVKLPPCIIKAFPSLCAQHFQEFNGASAVCCCENHSENAWNPLQQSIPKQSGTAQACPEALTLIELWCEIKPAQY